MIELFVSEKLLFVSFFFLANFLSAGCLLLLLTSYFNVKYGIGLRYFRVYIAKDLNFTCLTHQPCSESSMPRIHIFTSYYFKSPVETVVVFQTRRCSGVS